MVHNTLFIFSYFGIFVKKTNIMDRTIKLGVAIRTIQCLLIILSALFFFSIFILALFTGYGFVLALALFVFLLLLNLLISRIYNVRISHSHIIVYNLYKCKSYDTGEFISVDTAFVSPPYFSLKIKRGKKYLFLGPMVSREFYYYFNGKTYAAERTKEIREFISEQPEVAAIRSV